MLEENVGKEKVFEWLALSAYLRFVFALSWLHVLEESILFFGTYIASTATYLRAVSLQGRALWRWGEPSDFCKLA